MITPEEFAEKMKVEILADIRAGVVPPSVKSYSDLHDYVDANCYGGSEALLDELHAAAPDNDEGHTQALNELCDLMNAAMEIVSKWLETGAVIGSSQSEAEIHTGTSDMTVIPRLSDELAKEANLAAIDRLASTDKYHHIVAWGKWLGFTPSTVVESIRLAEAENPPADVVQKVDGKWVRLGDVANESNRQRVDEIAKSSSRWR